MWFYLFADDSNLFLSNKDTKTLEHNANSALTEVSEWLNTNKLSLNVEKSNYVIFHPPPKKAPSLKLSVIHKTLKHKECLKYLGVLIDSKLTWKPYIREISKKISRSVGIISKIRHTANSEVLIKLYYAIIYPFLIYGLLAWGSTYPTTLKNIIILQKKAIRIITSSKYDAHTNLLFHQLCILKLPDLVFMQRTLFMFDFHHNNTPSAFSKFFTSLRKVHNYNTRLSSKSSYYTPAIRTNYGKFSLRYQGPVTWNSIDQNIKEISYRKSFKDKIKTQIINSYI